MRGVPSRESEEEGNQKDEQEMEAQVEMGEAGWEKVVDTVLA